MNSSAPDLVATQTQPVPPNVNLKLGLLFCFESGYTYMHMTQDIKRYVSKLEATLCKKLSRSDLERLYKLHIQRVSDFQHERFIHLVITLFFGIVAISAYTLLMYVSGNTALAVGLLCIVLTILEGGYLLHYYRLGNGLQKLYDYTEKLAR